MIKLQVDLLSLIQYNRIIKLPTKKELIQRLIMNYYLH